RAFTASTSIPAIYVQQFWNTMKYDEKTGFYSCQVDEQWIDLSVDLLRKALAITLVDPGCGNMVIDFVNELGYPKPVEIVSNIRVNYVYQPWRAILTLINQCLTKRLLAVTNPDTQFCKCCGESSLNLMLIMQSCYRKSLLKGSRHFSHIKQVTKPV
ncbi:hypothetical protein Tco_0387849, partial [Tanacetum coccineum]